MRIEVKVSSPALPSNQQRRLMSSQTRPKDYLVSQIRSELQAIEFRRWAPVMDRNGDSKASYIDTEFEETKRS